ncbi:MAG: malonyl-[acyl-carrier protein] O-methyltransferase BioC, partial [Candidatus Parabeggiatoa sp. nov. 1]
MAQELALLLGKKRHLIELGVGSGLMAEVLIKQIPDLVLTG